MKLEKWNYSNRNVDDYPYLLYVDEIIIHGYDDDDDRFYFDEEDRNNFFNNGELVTIIIPASEEEIKEFVKDNSNRSFEVYERETMEEVTNKFRGVHS